MENRFKVLVTFYNCEKYIKKCLSSIISQDYKNFDCMIIDDCSNDNSSILASRMIDGINNFTLIRNNVNKKQIPNMIEYIPKLCYDDNDIIVSIDGDDFLYGTNVFSKLNEVYQNPEILLTYGQYITLPNFIENKIIKGNSESINDKNDIYKIGKMFSHLKTMKYSIFKKIPDEDFRRWDGKYIQRAGDMPIMIGAMKRLDLKNIKYIDDILYVYNTDNPISEWKINEQEQMQEEKYIKDYARGKI